VRACVRARAGCPILTFALKNTKNMEKRFRQKLYGPKEYIIVKLISRKNKFFEVI